MSSENVELLKATFPEEVDLVQVFDSDDPIAAMVGDADLVAPDLDVDVATTRSGAPALHFEGLGGLEEWWREWLVPWDAYNLSFDEFIDAGDKVITFVTVHARTGRHGVAVEHRPAAVWTVSGGKLTAVSFFLERDEALKFAGIG